MSFPCPGLQPGQRVSAAPPQCSRPARTRSRRLLPFCLPPFPPAGRAQGKNKWERRCPLSPAQVKELVAGGYKVLVQPSTRRVFHDTEFAAAGATLAEDLSPASLVLGVKEVPIKELLPERTYMFFSHTIKAQPYNMPLLDELLRQRIRLVDYECIVEGGRRGNRRLVAFGNHAGLAGMVNIQRGLGERLLSLGHSTPFLNVASSFTYPDLAAAKRAVSACGERIAAEGTPGEFGPLVFTFCGDGNVSRGAQQIFDLLPHEMVDPADLPRLVEGGDADLRKVYGTVCTEQHTVRHKDGTRLEPGNYPHFYENPDQYVGVFHDDVAPKFLVTVRGCRNVENPG